MDRTFLERTISGLAHVLVLAGVGHLVIYVVALPLFPVNTLWFLLPTAVLLPPVWRWSEFVRGHLLQALSLHTAALLLGETPRLIRFLATIGLIGERWFMTGLEGRNITAAWSLMTGIVVFGGLIVFGLCIEGAMQAFSGKRHQHPLVGRFTAKW